MADSIPPEFVSVAVIAGALGAFLLHRSYLFRKRATPPEFRNIKFPVVLSLNLSGTNEDLSNFAGIKVFLGGCMGMTVGALFGVAVFESTPSGVVTWLCALMGLPFGIWFGRGFAGFIIRTQEIATRTNRREIIIEEDHMKISRGLAYVLEIGERDEGDYFKIKIGPNCTVRLKLTWKYSKFYYQIRSEGRTYYFYSNHLGKNEGLFISALKSRGVGVGQ